MSKETKNQEKDAPEVIEASADWKEAFDHAAKAARAAFNAAAEATAEMLRQGGKLAEQTVSEAHRTIVVTLDEETYQALDKMVSAGIHKNRGDEEGASALAARLNETPVILVEVEPEAGCGCAGARGVSAPAWALGLCLLLLGVRRQRRRYR